MKNFSVGDTVLVEYNSGKYICEYEEDRGNFSLVKVLAVVKHPEQGDLHNPGQVDGVAFFERKALAHTERINARNRMIRPYSGDVPNYNESLEEAFKQLKSELSKEDTPFNRVSLQRLQDLKEHFYQKENFS